ncbi:hypothetical protein [Achromobacter sp. ACM05]|uniref:hypothetical protein n=1 Tax=Achromobacter sp. ACM05 TaxID=2854776 RepID=UPI001C44594D|nr:hypothetical protein [Achromobacter sp. ACM05]MBV7502056.1 hypothetical protein [Achromobacter sp. ACM05]
MTQQWKLVPVAEPTPEMRDAFARVFHDNEQADTFGPAVVAMLEAAPTPPASAQDDAKDERATLARKAIEWATPGNVMAAPLVACEHIRGMATLVLKAPAAGDARDAARLDWIAQNAWAIRDLENGRKNALVWQQPRTSTEGALDRLRAAIDAAIAASQQQEG